jgi:antirestriction protein ArdC
MSNSDSTDKRDFYARVTSQIVTAIENGAGSWRMPWHMSGRFAFSPINVTSNKPYRGINTVCLWAAAQSKGYAIAVTLEVGPDVQIDIYQQINSRIRPTVAIQAAP